MKIKNLTKKQLETLTYEIFNCRWRPNSLMEKVITAELRKTNRVSTIKKRLLLCQMIIEDYLNAIEDGNVDFTVDDDDIRRFREIENNSHLYPDDLFKIN